MKGLLVKRFLWVWALIIATLVAFGLVGGQVQPDLTPAAMPVSVEYGGTLDYGVIGDSISDPCNQGQGFCLEFEGLLDANNIQHTRRVYAHSGWSCTSLWQNQAELNALLSVRMDVVFVFCGTNDGNGTAAQQQTEANSWKGIATAIHNSGSLVAPSWVQYSDPWLNRLMNRQWLTDNGLGGQEGRSNDIIYSARYSLPNDWFTWWVDFQKVPGNQDYLQVGTPGRWDGIHPNQRGYKAYANIMYNSLRLTFNFPDTVSPACGMYGGRWIYNPPQFTPCS